MRNILGASLRRACFVCLLLSPLLNSCSVPKIRVVVDHLRPEMLKGRTVGLEGMDITAAYWPGVLLDEPIMYGAEKVLQRRLKGAQVCLLNHDGTVSESFGARRDEPAKTPAKEPDYIFRILLRADSVNHTLVKEYLVGTGRLTDRRNPGFPAFGGWQPRATQRSYSGNYVPMRPVNKRILKADYVLSDGHTHQLLWRAEAESEKQFFFANYLNLDAVEAEVPLYPRWMAMNVAAVKAIGKKKVSAAEEP